jgi:hypothetical protein
MPGSTERKMKARIYQRRRRNTMKGSVLLKSYYNTENKRIQNLFTRKGINPNTAFNKPLKTLEQRQLADFIRKMEKNLNELVPGEIDEELQQLQETKGILLKKIREELASLLGMNIMSDVYDEQLTKLEEITTNFNKVNERIEEILKRNAEKSRRIGIDIHTLVKKQAGPQQATQHKYGIQI